MNAKKYKVGDMVKVIKTDPRYEHEILYKDLIGKIIGDELGTYYVEFPDRASCVFTENQLCLK